QRELAARAAGAPWNGAAGRAGGDAVWAGWGAGIRQKGKDMSALRLRILLPSDVFPPRCGGAGWSAHALALALIERGHAVTAIVPRRATKNEGRTTKELFALRRSSFVLRRSPENVLGVPTIRADYWAPPIPSIQDYS